MGIQLWEQSQQSVNSFENLYAVYDKCFSGDGAKILSLAEDGSVRVWESATGKAVVRLSCPTEAHGAIFVKGGSQIAAWSKGKTIAVWDMPDGKFANGFPLGKDLKDERDNVTVSPDGRFLLTGHGNQTVRVRDLATGKQLHQYETEPQGSPRSLTFSPDSRMAAGGSFRGWVYLWSMPSLERER